MKTIGLTLGIALVGIAAGSARADTVVLDGGPGYGGGSFGAVITRTAGSPFGTGPNIATRTFCVETTQYFSPGTSYNVTYAMATTSGTSLNSATAWAFSQAMAGTLELDGSATPATFNIFSGTASQQKAVQAAIWKLMGQANPFSLSGAEQTIRDYVYGRALTEGTGSFYGVRVMQLAGNHQDQLVLVPLPQAAWAGMSMMAGVVGMAYIRRRKQQQA
ncbi:MAG: hypothetical protein IT437_11960 [Phycisphaerales bacterium]|nr:hypothetical protein [Phycisphaerales bacterium]